MNPYEGQPNPIAVMIATILAQQAQGQLQSFGSPLPAPQHGAQLQDGPVGENAQLGWGTAPEMQYQRPPVRRRPAPAPMQHPGFHYLPVPKYAGDNSHAPQHVQIGGQYGTYRRPNRPGSPGFRPF